jgi:FkbM family methyltransferase
MKNYVIIGAMDGISHDNIFDRLKDETDYQAYFIEPIPHYFNKLKENIKQLSNAKASNFFISDSDGSVEMAYVKPEWISKDSAFLDGCSSLVENAEPLNRYLKELPKSIIETIRIAAITFDQYCNWFDIKDIHYLQIDTEGCDERILNTIDLDKYNVKELKFENHYISDNFYTDLLIKYPHYKGEIVGADIILKGNT